MWLLDGLMLLHWSLRLIGIWSAAEFTWIKYVWIATGVIHAQLTHVHAGLLLWIGHASLEAWKLGRIGLHNGGQETHQILQIVGRRVPGLQVRNQYFIVTLQILLLLHDSFVKLLVYEYLRCLVWKCWNYNHFYFKFVIRRRTGLELTLQDEHIGRHRHVRRQRHGLHDHRVVRISYQEVCKLLDYETRTRSVLDIAHPLLDLGRLLLHQLLATCVMHVVLLLL